MIKHYKLILIATKPFQIKGYVFIQFKGILAFYCRKWENMSIQF